MRSALSPSARAGLAGVALLFGWSVALAGPTPPDPGEPADLLAFQPDVNYVEFLMGSARWALDQDDFMLAWHVARAAASTAEAHGLDDYCADGHLLAADAALQLGQLSWVDDELVRAGPCTSLLNRRTGAATHRLQAGVRAPLPGRSGVLAMNQLRTRR